MSERSIGLDIGSSAVRAAQVRISGDKPTLERYAQVALTPGAVRDGDILDPEVVTDAIKRLWKVGNYGSKDVIVGFASQRMFVREMSMPDLPDEDIGSALRFEAQELIPVPMDELTIDFEVLERIPEGDDEEARVRLLFAAAPTDALDNHIEVIKRAGLFVAGIDLSPFAQVRALKGNRWEDSSEASQADAIIGLGATMTSIVIAEGRIPQFVRVLPMAGDDITTAVAIAQKVEHDEAEGLKRQGGTEVGEILSAQMRSLVEEVGSSLDYYLAQNDSLPLGQIHLTGGGLRLQGIRDELRRRLGVNVEVAHPLERFDIGDVGLSPEVLLEAEPVAVTALGLALAGSDVPAGERRVSLLPRGAGSERDRQKQVRLVGSGIAAFFLVLAGLWLLAQTQVQGELNKAEKAEKESAIISAEVTKLSDVAQTKAAIQKADKQVTGVLESDNDWLRLLRQVSAMTDSAGKREISLISFSGQTGTPSTLTVTASARSEDSLANWLARGADVSAIRDLWIPSANRDTTTGIFQFSSTANLTDVARSDRAARLTSSSNQATK